MDARKTDAGAGIIVSVIIPSNMASGKTARETGITRPRRPINKNIS